MEQFFLQRYIGILAKPLEKMKNFQTIKFFIYSIWSEITHQDTEKIAKLSFTACKYYY